MKPCLFSLLLILTLSCQPKSTTWQTLDFGAFKLQTPPGWTKLKLRGIDSYVGGLTNGKDTLSFDYGMYSPEIGDEDPKKHLIGQDTINGLFAQIAIPISPGDGFIGMYIPLNQEDRFSIGGYNIKSTDTILKIFKSIVFAESDTAANSKLISKFKQYPNGSGKTLFRQYCMSCHSLTKIVEGPKLTDLLQERDATWLYNFLTNRKMFLSDSSYLKIKKNYGVECPEFSMLKKQDVDAIFSYVKFL